MARIPIWKDDDPAMPEDVREAIDYAKGGTGFALNIQREMANNPAVLKGFSDLASTFYGEGGGTITPAERELAYTTATVVNNCHY